MVLVVLVVVLVMIVVMLMMVAVVVTNKVTKNMTNRAVMIIVMTMHAHQAWLHTHDDRSMWKDDWDTSISVPRSTIDC